MEFVIPLVLFIGGIVGGLYASSVGGGALLSFPLLILAGLPTHSAIATQRFAAVILELASAAKFYKEKQLDLKLGLILGLFAAIGSYIGAQINLVVSEETLNLMVSFLFVAAFLIIFNKDKLKIKERKLTHKNFVILALSTFLLAIYGGFFGAGFGFFIIILLVVSGFSFIKGAAVGRVVGFFMSLSSAIVFAHNGIINFSYGLSIGAGFAIGSWVGVGIAVKRGDNYVRSLLVVIMILTLLKLLSGFFNLRF